jgi:hypothetical protein
VLSVVSFMLRLPLLIFYVTGIASESDLYDMLFVMHS